MGCGWPLSSASRVQRNGDVEMFLRDVCGFLKRRTSFITSEGADKKLLNIFREQQPSVKVRAS